MFSSRVGKGTAKFAPKFKPRSQTESQPEEGPTIVASRVAKFVPKIPTKKRQEDLETNLLVEEHDAFLTDEEQLPMEKNAPPVIAKTGTIISTPAAKSTIIALPTAKPTPTLTQTMDQDGNSMIDIPATSIRDLIDSDFSQGKISQAHIKLVEMKKNERMRKKLKIEKEENTPILQSNKTIKGGPRLKIVNGQIEVDVDSLYVDQSTGEEHLADMEFVEEETHRYITSASFRKNKVYRHRWGDFDTSLFYKGLSYFGTDLSLITVFINSQLFLANDTMGQFNRKQVKQKFVYEEKSKSYLITRALRKKQIPPPEIWDKMKQFVQQMSQEKRRISQEEGLAPIMEELDNETTIDTPLETPIETSLETPMIQKERPTRILSSSALAVQKLMVEQEPTPAPTPSSTPAPTPSISLAFTTHIPSNEPLPASPTKPKRTGQIKLKANLANIKKRVH